MAGIMQEIAGNGVVCQGNKRDKKKKKNETD